MVARFVRDEEVVGSNPATPTSENAPSQTRDGALWEPNREPSCSYILEEACREPAS